MKISVILPTNKINTQEELDKFNEIHMKIKGHKIFGTWEFSNLNVDALHYVEHVLQPTLHCLSEQTFDDFEVLLCHRYPDDAEQLVKDFSNYMDIKLIKEKPSIWHELGDEFRTVNNIRNTGIIKAKGELLLFLDDYTIFGPDLLQKAWDAYQDGYYITARGMRRIRYNPEAEPKETRTRKAIVDKGIYSSYNFNHVSDGDIIPNSASWTYCCTVSLEEALRINGFDEIYDGNFGGTDQDFGVRLAKITKYKRKLLGTVYEFAHKSPRMILRNDEILRQICGQMFPKHVRANEWKPREAEMRRYRKWHQTYIGYLDPLWDKFLDVPMYDLKEKRE